MHDYNSSTLEYITIHNKRYKTEPPVEIPDVIFALSFGLNHHQSSVNQRLAESIMDIRTYFDAKIPAIIQDRITPCLETLNASDYYSIGKDSSYDWRLDSRDILTQTKEKAEELGLTIDKVLYVAHPSHVQRVMDAGLKLGLSGSPFVLDDVQWSKNDSEIWVSSSLWWIPREILARIIYKFKDYT